MSDQDRRGRGRPADRDSSVTRQKLLDAARECFGEFGFYKTSNNEIVDRAGVTTGPLYHHFGSKSGLYGAVADDSIEKVFGHPESVLTEQGESHIIDRLGALLRTVAELHSSDESLARFDAIGPLEIRRNPDLVEHIDPSQLARMNGLFASVVESAVANGELNSSVAAATLSHLITVLYFGLIYYCAVMMLDVDPEEVVDAIMAGLTGSLFRPS